MKCSAKVTVVVDNTVYKQGLLAEHGLSILIECDGERVLFDTGQGMALPSNLCQLNLDPKTFDKLVLSHNHYDHTGGVAYILDKAPSDLELYAHPDFMNPCFSKRCGNVRSIGLGDITREKLNSHKGKTHWSLKPTQVSETMWVTGGIPRIVDTPTTDKFYTDINCSKPNIINDDQSLFINTDNGTVVILGCAHSGVIEILEYIKTLTNSNLYAVVGGMHLIHATEKQRFDVAKYLKDNNVKLVAPLHCSGFEGRRILANALGDKYRSLSVGEELIF